jgi:hypothetical protein
MESKSTRMAAIMKDISKTMLSTIMEFTNGPMGTSTRENSRIAIVMVKGNLSDLMELTTKANGLMMYEKEKESKNIAGASFRDNLRMANPKEKSLLLTTVEINTLVTIKMANKTVKEPKYTQTETNIRVNGRMDKGMDMENSIGKMVMFTKENMKMTKGTAVEFIFIKAVRWIR